MSKADQTVDMSLADMTIMSVARGNDSAMEETTVHGTCESIEMSADMSLVHDMTVRHDAGLSVSMSLVSPTVTMTQPQQYEEADNVCNMADLISFVLIC